MFSLKSMMRNTPAAARIELGAAVNKRYGLTLQPKRLAVVTDDIPSLTNKAVTHPMSNPLLIARVQELVVVDELVAVHMTLDLHAKEVADFIVQSVVQGFSLVLVDRAKGSARTLTLKESSESRVSEEETKRGMSIYRNVPSQAKAYVACVGLIGYEGCSGALDALRRPRAANRVFFRPVFGDEHQGFLPASLGDLIAASRDVPTLGSIGEKLFGAKLLGMGSLQEMTAMAECYHKPHH
jgi:hypothetical protein